MSLVPLSDFDRSGSSPVNIRALVFKKGPSLERYGALVRYGRKLLVDPELLDQWLRDNSRKEA
jgi:hypothetical protein